MTTFSELSLSDDNEKQYLPISTAGLSRLWIQQLYSQQQVDDIKNIMHDYLALDKVYIMEWIKKLQLNDFDLFS